MAPMGRVGKWLWIASLIICAPGCSVISARWHAFFQDQAERRLLAQQLALEEVRAVQSHLDDEKLALKEEHDLELARLHADLEKQRCQVRSQYDESLRTKIGMDLDQRIQVGQLQVNMEEMRRLMEERDRDYTERMREYNDQRPQMGNGVTQPYSGPWCGCAAPLCAAPGPDCEAPHRWNCCQRCGNPTRPQVGGDCAGVRPFREAPQKPIRQPITAMEIPLMVPVRLELGVTNSYLNEAEIRRLPYEQQESRPLQAPCGQCGGCQVGGPCDRCVPRPDCEAPVVPQPAPPSDTTFVPQRERVDDEPGISRVKERVSTRLGQLLTTAKSLPDFD